MLSTKEVRETRPRQVGQDTLHLTLYRVDDLSGSIAGLAPGEAGYAEAAQARAYLTAAGASVLGGPGYGRFAQAQIVDVDAGDYIAMRLDNLSRGTTFWAFANANETVGGQAVNHLWNYGLNTWGWEDTGAAATTTTTT